jgi:hypothetical protein
MQKFVVVQQVQQLVLVAMIAEPTHAFSDGPRGSTRKRLREEATYAVDARLIVYAVHGTGDGFKIGK